MIQLIRYNMTDKHNLSINDNGNVDGVVDGMLHRSLGLCTAGSAIITFSINSFYSTIIWSIDCVYQVVLYLINWIINEKSFSFYHWLVERIFQKEDHLFWTQNCLDFHKNIFIY